VTGFESGLTQPDHAVDRLAVALLRLRRDGTEAALDAVTHHWPVLTVPSELRLRAIRELSIVLKRSLRYDEAVAQWTRALSDPSRAIRLFAAEELAKHFEHRQRDYVRALDIARRGADGATLIADDLAAEAFTRRVERLERKLGLHDQPAGPDEPLEREHV
jgi:HEAT repeat protein